ncbi:hypothetical protein [Tabrizicola sp.]|uniref:hypothetical protein n=1 Tax=Tabrizicola sp. TaxID=2005166 RepID=UPI002869F289|nr:hypothetical protein [Tabrizicola sp.]
MVTAYTRMLLGMLQNRIEERLGQMINTERMLEDAVYASAVMALARGTLNGELRVLASLLWPVVQSHFEQTNIGRLQGCPPSRASAPRHARILAFPRPALA